MSVKSRDLSIVTYFVVAGVGCNHKVRETKESQITLNIKVYQNCLIKDFIAVLFIQICEKRAEGLPND